MNIILVDPKIEVKIKIVKVVSSLMILLTLLTISLHADADEAMYMMPPPDITRPGYCWVYKKAAIGRRKAPQFWQKHFA